MLRHYTPKKERKHILSKFIFYTQARSDTHKFQHEYEAWGLYDGNSSQTETAVFLQHSVKLLKYFCFLMENYKSENHQIMYDRS
jgi:hypothetical protein